MFKALNYLKEVNQDEMMSYYEKIVDVISKIDEQLDFKKIFYTTLGYFPNMKLEEFFILLVMLESKGFIKE